MLPSKAEGGGSDEDTACESRPNFTQNKKVAGGEGLFTIPA